jgi:hypothetical protein
VGTVSFSGPLASPVSDLGGPAGFGPVSASGPGNGLLAVRSSTGAPGAALLAPDNAGQAARTADSATWRTAGPLFVGAPAGAPTGPHGTTLAALGQDGRLLVTETDGRGPLSPWRPVG